MKELKKILESKPKVEDYDCQPYGYINALQNYINKLEEAINYSRCCETLKDNEITFHEFTREFCIRAGSDLWLYKGIKYNDLELDLVYKQYINDLNL